ncbi:MULTISPECIES: hypothetical protein [Olivibacter]|uniref:Cyclic lactone autoinducer peptide n=1 Tax=Olivibacter jilunii TaxID=985016 RepID=A0ABW6B0L8_9SPHI
MKKAKLIFSAVAVVIVSSFSYAMANRGNGGCPLPSDRPNCHIIPPPKPKPR